MTLLAHISDVHFGREDPEIVEGLLDALRKTRPDVIVVSGDLTQRARKSQYRAARAFLRSLPDVPRLVVPGNHDVSATNLYDRLAHPLKRYRRYITSDLSPYVDGEDYAIAGINTVRLLSRKDGRINRRQVACACEQLGRAAEGAVRIVVTHHPMDLPLEDKKHALVARSRMAMRAFSACQVDLFLSGHLHAGQTVVTTARYAALLGRDRSNSEPPETSEPYFGGVVVQAGTAVSTRTRGEPNTWNLIRLGGRADGAVMTVQQRLWSPESKSFVEGASSAFERKSTGWTACPAPTGQV